MNRPAEERARMIFETAGDLLAEIRRFAEDLEAPGAGEDDVAQLILAGRELASRAREAKRLADSAVLDWLERHRETFPEIVIGDYKYFGTVNKSVRCRDVGDCWEALMESSAREAFLEATGGDLTAWEAVRDELVGLFRVCVSTNGLKTGAVKSYLGQAFETHFETTYPAAVKGQPAEKKLGVANLRFLHNLPEASAAELRALGKQRPGVGVPGRIVNRGADRS